MINVKTWNNLELISKKTFNSCSSIFNNYKSLQDDEQQTEPPPRAKFSDTVTQFVIYDAYVTYEAEKEALEEQDRKGKSNEQNKYKRLLGETQVEPNDEANESLLKSARILERMVNQNTFNEIALGE